jgi:hypothetical protein
LRPVHRIRNTFATPTDPNKKSPPKFEGGALAFRQHALILGIFALFLSKIVFFCGLGGIRTCDLTDVNGAF